MEVIDIAAESEDSLADVQIAPDPGSSNPFAAGADRTTERRAYTVDVVSGAVPAFASETVRVVLALWEPNDKECVERLEVATGGE